jgi:Cdc6-like AAA superfamily ATPase
MTEKGKCPMKVQKRTFETRGPVYPDLNYVVSRRDELAELINRIKRGRYIVISAPRQTGKTTFFKWALEKLVEEDPTFLAIQLDFEIYVDVNAEAFYADLQREILEEILKDFQRRQVTIDERLQQLVSNESIKNHLSFRVFLKQLSSFLGGRKVVMIIDEFDGIPQDALRGFLHSLRRIYLSGEADRCPYSVGIVGVKSITQLNYDRSISPFNIQDDFALPNFTLN